MVNPQTASFSYIWKVFWKLREDGKKGKIKRKNLNFFLCAFTRKEKNYTIKIACLMPNFLNLKSKAIRLFSSSIQPQHTVQEIFCKNCKITFHPCFLPFLPCSTLQWLWPTYTQNPNVGLRGELLMLKQPEDAFVVEVKFNFLFSRRLR